MRALLLLSLVPLLGGCAHAGPRPALWDGPRQDGPARLERLAEAYWELLMEEHPVWATSLGDRRFDTRLPDVTPPGRRARLARLHALRAGAAALAEEGLDAEARISREALLAQLDAALVDEVCRPELWAVSPLDGAQMLLGELPLLHPIATRAHAEALVTRYRQAPALLEAHVGNLRRGLEEGLSAPRVAVERVVGQLQRMLAAAPESSSFVTAVALPPGWREEETEAVRAALVQAVRERLLPGLQRYLTFLREEYLPHAREAPGLGATPPGRACYAARIRALVGPRAPEDLHRVGLAEVERSLGAMRELARQAVGAPDVAALKAALRADPSQFLATREALLAHAEALVARAQAALPRAFRQLPHLGLEVRPMEALREEDSPAGLYFPGAFDGSRAGAYAVNLLRPRERALFLLEPLTFHEALPGHHLQMALALELTGVPRFRRELGDVAFIEGWAHYAELLADELGLYSGPAARFGMLSDQALRAARLVTDTGLHALGWSRERAVQYLQAHTAEGREECEREVDRYIVWPAQALTYKLGQLELLALRQEAQAALGPRFELGAFHAALLAHGAVPLPVLRRLMGEWLARQQAGGR